MLKFIRIVAIFLVIGLVTGLVIFIRERSLAPIDSDALIGGQLEDGYTATGFLITFIGDSSIGYCGATLLDSTTAVTAAHCLDASGQRYFGLGEFNSEVSALYPVSSIQQKAGWDRQSSNNDLALINLGRPVAFSEVARLENSAPLVGCGYRVVAYGRNNPDLNSPDGERDRKSTEICINNIVGDVIVMYAPQGGVCLGDSGSAVYIDRSNRMIGVISAVKKPANNSPTCFTGNTAFITRVDTGLEFVASVVGQNKMAEFTSNANVQVSVTSSVNRSVTSQITANSNSARPTPSRTSASAAATRNSTATTNNAATITSKSSAASSNNVATSTPGINLPQPNPSVSASASSNQTDFLLLVVGVGILLTLGTIIYLALGFRNRR